MPYVGLRCLVLASVYLACAVQAQSCGKPPAGPNMVLPDADNDKDTFADGTSVRFRCDIGYTFDEGSPTVTCRGGVWSPAMPTLVCQLKNCGSLGEITNGGADTPDGTLHGATATFHCNPGYFMIPQNARRDCIDGTWDGRNPVCNVVKCGPPPTIVDGELTTAPGTEFEYGSVAQYRCNSDKHLVGESTIVCRQQGTSDVGVWEPSPPECKTVQCQSPSVQNGRRIAGFPPYVYRSFVTFECNANFVMDGQATSTCDLNSEWSPPLPTCQVKATTTTKAPTTTTTTASKTPTIKGPDPTEPPGPPDGAIVGGVIGGLAFIGIVIGVVFWQKKTQSK